MTRPTVLLGMSGGVDSSVAAALLIRQGYDVRGVTLQVWEHEDEHVAVSKKWQERGCCKIGIAKHVAGRLGISHEVIDTRARFQHGVIDDFLSGYLNGTTPNPCVRCNERVKLRALVELADQMKIDYIATGHYARIAETNGRWSLARATDAKKDQTYFLYRMPRTWLPRLLFPVGSMQKRDVWDEAAALDLPADELKESQEICFVSQGDYRSFIEKEAPQAKRPGPLVDQSGRRLGEHEGIAFYTPGQRRGLGVAVGERLYVHEVQAATNTVVVSPEGALQRSACEVAELNLFDDALTAAEATPVEVKIRYATPAVAATVMPLDSGRIRLCFASPQRALSPGQSAVFYHGETVLGGGIIQRFTV